MSLVLAGSLVLTTGALHGSGVHAQPRTQDGPLPQFDVASVKRNTLLEQPSNNWRRTPGRVDYHNSQLVQLIKAAWGDFSLRVEGGPGWITTDRFDVVVQYPVDTPAATVTLMLRALLIDRFKLAAHLVTREIPIYSLVVARPDRSLGAKLKPGIPECAPNPRSNPPPQCRQGGGSGLLHFDYADMTLVVRALSSIAAVGRPVVDNTGLTGNYKIDLQFAPAQALSAVPPGAGAQTPPLDPDTPSIFTAIQEQLGLKLDDAKGQVPVLVLDHIEQPTPD